MIQTKDIGNHIIYSDGRVWSKRDDKFLKSRINRTGYNRFSIKGKNKYIHRAVAEAFIPNPLDLPQVNHKNGKKWDNRVENLEWCTSKQNIKHAIEMGLCTTGEDCYQAKLTEKQVKEIRSFPKGVLLKDIAKQYDASVPTISNIRNNKRWKHI